MSSTNTLTVMMHNLAAMPSRLTELLRAHIATLALTPAATPHEDQQAFTNTEERRLIDALGELPASPDMAGTCPAPPHRAHQDRDDRRLRVVRGIMNELMPSTRQLPTGQTTSLKRLEDEYPTDADLILLCSFREDPDGELTYEQLRKGLLTEGFRGPLARYLIRSSGILHRVSRSRYRLRATIPDGPLPTAETT